MIIIQNSTFCYYFLMYMIKQGMAHNHYKSNIKNLNESFCSICSGYIMIHISDNLS